ncbi:MAG: STAS domain-containing protein [Succinivibrio sp.]|nr:STAS domain-containing protein [Succinivibrio sp.]
MSSSFEIYTAPGSLTCRSVPALYDKRAELFKYAAVDLKELAEIDSAGVALLVKWARAQPDGRLTISHVPDTALRLIKTYKLTALFNL